MTPGAYLRLRRLDAGYAEAAGLQLPAHSMADIEAGAAPLTFLDVKALANHIWFDEEVLADLCLAEVEGGDIPHQICRECGCTECTPCHPPCAWSAPDLCDNPACLEKAGAA